jgi:hypothetical protein
LWNTDETKGSIEDRIAKWNQRLLSSSIKSTIANSNDVFDREKTLTIYDGKTAEVNKWIKDVGIEGIAVLFLEVTNKKFNETFTMSKAAASQLIYGMTTQFVNTIVYKRYPILADMVYCEVSELVHALLFNRLNSINMTYSAKIGSFRISMLSRTSASGAIAAIAAPNSAGAIAAPNSTDLVTTSSSSKRRRISDMLVMQQI